MKALAFSTSILFMLSVSVRFINDDSVGNVWKAIGVIIAVLCGICIGLKFGKML